MLKLCNAIVHLMLLMKIICIMYYDIVKSYVHFLESNQQKIGLLYKNINPVNLLMLIVKFGFFFSTKCFQISKFECSKCLT